MNAEEAADSSRSLAELRFGSRLCWCAVESHCPRLRSREVPVTEPPAASSAFICGHDLIGDPQPPPLMPAPASGDLPNSRAGRHPRSKEPPCGSVQRLLETLGISLPTSGLRSSPDPRSQVSQSTCGPGIPVAPTCTVPTLTRDSPPKSLAPGATP